MTEDPRLSRPFCCAGRHGDLELVRWLAEEAASAAGARRPVSMERPAADGSTPAQVAARGVHAPPTPGTRPSESFPALAPLNRSRQVAALEGHLPVLRYLHRAGADVLRPNAATGDSALHVAAAAGQTDVVRWLVCRSSKTILYSIFLTFLY
jgi:ankyrin repeat protein